MSGVDKIFVRLRDKPLLAWSVDVCQGYELVDRIAVVLSAWNVGQGRRLLEERGWSKVMVCVGGARRQDSVRNGMAVLKDDEEWIVIHDAARPFLREDMIRRGLEAASETGAAVAAVPAKETLKMVDAAGVVIETPERSQLWVVQTPQVFRRAILKEAYRVVEESVTDDASLVERAGYRVCVYEGSYRNIKVTTPEDLDYAEVLAASES
jgi:2-C-methyl-D-erythritol 4-phosphate cytidylyltransferase